VPRAAQVKEVTAAAAAAAASAAGWERRFMEERALRRDVRPRILVL